MNPKEASVAIKRKIPTLPDGMEVIILPDPCPRCGHEVVCWSVKNDQWQGRTYRHDCLNVDCSYYLNNEGVNMFCPFCKPKVIRGLFS